MRVAAGAVARQILNAAWGDGFRIRGAMVKMGPLEIDRARWDWDIVADNPFWCPDAASRAGVGALSDGRAQGRLLGRGGAGNPRRGRAAPVWASRSTTRWTPTSPRR